MRSILAGAAGIATVLSGHSLKVGEKRQFKWDADYLYFSVREPWPSKTSSADITFGKITTNAPLILTSHMPENGVIFSDGVENDFVSFNSGIEAIIGVAKRKGLLVT